ncbi:PHB depolymerase family esterase [Methylobacterium sp. NEAU 140]|uniref:extracellular catalytic domain type 1 short-chain-length polyhydroxyalkanoate depolymerase n=1 Tax=Methylobacterium sp. NEAU 140 TaxID=3064945 RepID=UPI00273733D7|nr:PHB depolymerase family esterase [Methylobacterium sp. NEAU 140]MDP4025305.1 PHB depolymerase family esterase [Methylobacterium sp. NEAU 140]
MSKPFGKIDGHGASPLSDMLEATRLTGLGRLEEATALIQRSLTGRSGAAPAQPPGQAALEPPTLDLKAERRGEASEAPGPAPQARMRGVVDSVVRGLAPVLKGLGQPLRPAPAGRGPARPPGSSSFVARSHADAAGARDYKLFIPSDPQVPAPLVVMLHGCTQNPDDFAAGTGMNALAERAGIYVAYPGQSRSAHPQKCWNWYEPGDQGREAGEPAIIAGITRAVMAAHAIDPARVYIAGMSAGGAAALNIAHAYPDLYAAIGVHSGLAAGCARDLGSALMAMQVGAPGLGTAPSFGAPTVGRRVPLIVFHGEEDGTVSPRNAEQILAQAGASGLTAATETFEGKDAALRGHAFTRTRYADRTGQVVLEDWRVRGQGHAWSGGLSEGSYTDPDGPDASRAMLDFFAEHRLPKAA